MRVAVVYFQSGYGEVKKTAEALARGISAGNHMVDLINGETDTDKKLTGYQYLVIGGAPISFFSGKISERISPYLKNSGMLSGKRSYAFIRKKGLASSKALKNLMIEMEKEGMMLKISDVLYSSIEAEAAGKKLHINK
jgi:menaquinone-dependent protoporphyrinogen IX oxidase